MSRNITNPKVKELQLKIEELHKTMIEESKKAFADASKELFNDFPEMESFSVTGWTPYFSDGDENIFSVHTDYPTINGVGGDDIEYSNEYIPLRKVLKEVKDFLQGFSDDIYQSMFGDHFEVIVNRDGSVTIEERSDHD